MKLKRPNDFGTAFLVILMYVTRHICQGKYQSFE
ncbi:hypothetical protein [Staphylococcus epidermidis]